MQPDRIADLLAPFFGSANDQRLTTDDAVRISTYIDLLLRWNARINLTAIRDPEEIVTRHFGESLFAASHLFPHRNHSLWPSVSPVVKDVEVRADAHQGRKDHSREDDGCPSLADIGSGAGFPGIPIKLWAPDLEVTLIESNHKKATFLREVARVLTLTDIYIQNARAETLLGRSFDVVTLRAVERFAEILPTAAALVAPEGRLALLIGTTQHSTATASLPGLAWSDPVPIPLAESRMLLIGHKRSTLSVI